MAGMMRLIGKAKEMIKYNRRGKSNHETSLEHEHCACHQALLISTGGNTCGFNHDIVIWK